MMRLTGLTKHLFLIAALWVVATITALSSVQARAQPDRPFPVVTAPGVAFMRGDPASVFFLNNDELIYHGASEEEYAIVTREHIFPVRIWNWRTGKVRTIDRAALRDLCFDGQTISFTAKGGDNVVTKQGPLNALREEVRPKEYHYLDSMNERGEGRHRFHCRNYRHADLGAEGICRISLRDGDGMIDARGRWCRESEQRELARIRASASTPRQMSKAVYDFEQQLLERPALYFAAPNATPVSLPIKSREMHPFGAGISYSEFAGAYVIKAYQPREGTWTGAWPVGLPVPVYLLKRGGDIKRVAIPYDVRWRGSPAQVTVVRPGIALRSTNVKYGNVAGSAGVYLLEETGAVRHIFRAISLEMKASPDGCRLAVDSLDASAKISSVTVVRMNVIDLCARDTP